MDKSQTQVRPGFLLGLFFVFIVLPFFASYLLPVYVGGKPKTRDLARLASRAYLDYAKQATTNGAFRFERSPFLKFAATNYNFSQAGIGHYSTTGQVNESVIQYTELYNSFRSIFNTNQDFWAKTNFYFSISNREPVIVCKRQLSFPQARNYFGCSFSRLKPAFVVGYSDGSTALISQEEYSSLNLDGFVPLSSLGIEGFHAQFQ